MEIGLDPRFWDRVMWGETHNIPAESGCYALINVSDKILYIGRSKVLWVRLKNPKKHVGFNRKTDPDDEVFIAWSCGWEIYDREKDLIKEWKPPLSIK